MLRAGAQPCIALARRARQPAAMRLVMLEREVRKQGGEHLPVAAVHLREASDHVVAFEEADFHVRKWKDFGRVNASRPRRDRVQPRPESLTPVQASAGSR